MLERAFRDPGKRAMYRAMRPQGVRQAISAAHLLPPGHDADVVTRTVQLRLAARHWPEPERPESYGGTW